MKHSFGNSTKHHYPVLWFPRISVLLICCLLEQDAKNNGQKSATPVSRQRRYPRDKKTEQITKEAADYAKKHGICSIHVPVAPLFVGQYLSFCYTLR